MQNSLLTINIAVHRSHFLYLIFSFSILTFTLNLKGANYYVDATNGYDQNTGLVRFGARDYDPRVGRYVQSDPAGVVSLVTFVS